MADLRKPIAVCLATGLTVFACIGEYGELAHNQHEAAAAAFLDLARASSPAARGDVGEHDPPTRYPTESARAVTGAVASTSDLSSFFGSQNPSTSGWTFVPPPRRKI
jgi:hypothetical protein